MVIISGVPIFRIFTVVFVAVIKGIQKIILLKTALKMCVCVPILVTTFPEWLSGTEPLPHTPGAVRPSSLCL